ncbi:MAG: hypothetical protein ACLPN5_10650 [Roseiarcus sp.]
MTPIALPPALERVRALARRSIAPIKPADSHTKADKDFLFTATRSEAGRKLPAPHLVYFLLVELLGFKDLGNSEKLAWSIPIDFNGDAYLIEHRKFGAGVFTRGIAGEEDIAKRIVDIVRKTVGIAQPFFHWKADNAIGESKLNVVNNSAQLFERFQYMKTIYRAALSEANRRKDETKITIHSPTASSITRPYFELIKHAQWLAMATVDAFFSWTEHVFIHIAILQGYVTTGAEVAKLAGDE